MCRLLVLLPLPWLLVLSCVWLRCTHTILSLTLSMLLLLWLPPLTRSRPRSQPGRPDLCVLRAVVCTLVWRL